jgi:predicted MPP superfamily phosphohydrolase
VRLLPVVAFVVVWLGVSWFGVGTLVHPLIPGGWITLAGVAVLGAIPIGVLARGFRGVAYPSAATRLLVLRPFWYAMLFLPVLAGAGLIGTVAGAPFGAGTTMGRWSLALTALGLTVGAAVGALGSRRLTVRHVEVASPDLPGAFAGLRILQLSDLHVGPHTSRRFLDRIVRAIRGAEPDLIAITGDQVDDYGADVEHFTAVFGGLSAPLGVYAVAGNHDVYAGWDEVHRGMADAGITVLVNEAVPVARRGQRIWIAGTGDPAGAAWQRNGGARAAPDIEATLAEVPAGAFTLALAHNPALWPELAARGVQLTLSGHTHHGQVSVPRLGWSLASPFLQLAMGAHRRGGAFLYINPGTNYWGIPLRIGALPEVTVITLRRSGDAVASVGAAFATDDTTRRSNAA